MPPALPLQALIVNDATRERQNYDLLGLFQSADERCGTAAPRKADGDDHMRADRELLRGIEIALEAYE